jgi:hypothetical protein
MRYNEEYPEADNHLAESLSPARGHLLRKEWLSCQVAERNLGALNKTATHESISHLG